MLVFVYGTLTDPDRAKVVLSEFTYEGFAVLDGLHRVEGEYPTLAPGGDVAGRLLETPEIDELDEYEGVPDLYVRVSVPIEGGGRAEVYVGDPERLDADAEWPGDGSFGERVRAYVEAETVVIGPGGDRQG